MIFQRHIFRGKLPAQVVYLELRSGRPQARRRKIRCAQDAQAWASIAALPCSSSPQQSYLALLGTPEATWTVELLLIRSVNVVVARCISFASTGAAKAHSFHGSSSPNGTRFAGLPFGLGMLIPDQQR